MIINESKLTYEFAKGTNIPNEITPNNGPPKSPKILREIWRTVVPAYWHRYASPIVINPNTPAINLNNHN